MIRRRGAYVCIRGYSDDSCYWVYVWVYCLMVCKRLAGTHKKWRIKLMEIMMIFSMALFVPFMIMIVADRR